MSRFRRVIPMIAWHLSCYGDSSLSANQDWGMENQHYEAVMKIADLEFREEFEKVASTLGVRKRILKLPFHLYHVFEAYEESKAAVPTVFGAVEELLLHVNKGLEEFADEELKVLFKHSLSVFCASIVKYILKHFEGAQALLFEQIDKGLQEYRKNATNIDVDDLDQYAEEFKQELALLNAPTPTLVQEQLPNKQSQAQFVFNKLTAPQFEKLKRCVHNYGVFSKMTDLQMLISPKGRKGPMRKIKPQKIDLAVLLLHWLWDDKYIMTTGKSFWVTLSDCLSWEGKGQGPDYLRKLFNKIQKNKTDKNLRSVQDLDEIAKTSCLEKRQNEDKDPTRRGGKK